MFGRELAQGVWARLKAAWQRKVPDILRLPMIDIHTVGAGGGSIAFKDSGGALRVGPRSAGANPGPACYGSGHELTVTDANLLLGRLDPDYFLIAFVVRHFRPLSSMLRLKECRELPQHDRSQSEQLGPTIET